MAKELQNRPDDVREYMRSVVKSANQSGKEVAEIPVIIIEEYVIPTLTDYIDCVNELCLKCGRYSDEFRGACDVCRWLLPRRGF